MDNLQKNILFPSLELPVILRIPLLVKAFRRKLIAEVRECYPDYRSDVVIDYDYSTS